MNDLDRAVAIIEDSRQTHVRWAAWRRKGNGTDTDHEMIGDLEWHENAIRDYDHVLSVLRAAPRAEGLDPLREAALRVILAQEAVRDAINGLGHPDEPHDSVLGDIRRDPTDEVQIIDTVDDCALCGGMQYGSEDTLNRAFGELRAALGLEVRPWEFPEDAARWLSSLSRPSDERVPESETCKRFRHDEHCEH